MTVSLHRLNETTPETFDWGWIRWLVNDRNAPGSPQTVGVVQIDAGQGNPMHAHPNCEELLYVTAGQCEHVLDGETVTMQVGDMIRIPAGVPHCARSLGDAPMQAMIIFSTGDRKTDMLGTKA